MQTIRTVLSVCAAYTACAERCSNSAANALVCDWPRGHWGDLGVHPGNQRNAVTIGVVVWAAIACAANVLAQSTISTTSGQILEPAVYQGPELGTQNGIPPKQSTIAQNDGSANALRMALQAAPPVPPQTIQVTPTSPRGSSATSAGSERSQLTAPTQSLNQPLLEGNASNEEQLPAGPEQVDPDNAGRPHQHIRPYGGGHPDDWSWGCGGSPYRTGPGHCDDYKVGPRWEFSIDGMVMSRESTDLEALEAAMEADHAGETDLVDPTFEQFDRGPGGRIVLMSQPSPCVGYQIQAVYEGIEDWDASVVFEKQDLEPTFFPAPLPVQPGDPFPEGFEQRSLHYSSSFHSGELNFMRSGGRLQLYGGVRYMKFNDTIRDFTNQEVQVPLPFEGPDNTPPGEFLAVAWTDRLNLFDIDNNLMGFQVGLFHDSWNINRRFSFEGFVNAGVYHNKVKYFNRMGVYTTQVIADDTSTINVNEARTDFSDAVNNDARDYSEISYHGEASLTGVCRLNKCWALRGGYQVLWVSNLHLADDAYLGDENVSRDLLFHGWHAGLECRR